MKILQVAPYFYPYVGGQEKYIYNLSRHLVRRGHEVHVVTANYPKSAYNTTIDGISIKRYDINLRILRNPISFKYFEIANIIHRYDLVHIHNEHSFSSLVVSRLKKRDRFPLLITIHGQLKFGNPFYDTFEKFYSKIYGRRIFDQCDGIVTLSQSDKQYIESFNPLCSNKISVLPNAIDHRSIDDNSKNDKNTLKNSNYIQIIYVGQLIKRKGIDWLIKAINLIKDQEALRLDIVGGGENEAFFKELVIKYNLQDIINFTGNISDQKLLMDYYKKADILILPSLSEGMPTVILEAMYLGIPVIASDIPGIKDHFKDTAILVDVCNEVALAQSLINLIRNRELQRKMSLSGKELVLKKYTWELLSKKYEDLYEIVSSNYSTLKK
jgi:glycosyltransferase involved in cell wall biosynthesis